MTSTLLHPVPPGLRRGAARPSWKYAAPSVFYPLAGRLLPWLYAVGALLLAAGLVLGFGFAPTDAQQGDAYRIIFLHVPAAWISMVVYLAMAFWGAVGYVFGTRLSFMLMKALAPTGALAAFLCLWTGALWGRPTWGAWWVWDARLTSVLLLLFLYLGFIALQAAIEDPRRADRAGALLAVVGAVNVPVIYFSVQWWNTLHQGATIRLGAAPSMAPDMLAALLLCALGLWAWAIASVLRRLRAIVLEREAGNDWVLKLPEVGA
ncbi:heme ABC transporter permease CcmC [Derxia gummosa]|uniref:Heme exporter protein C n=1 Tax=Derxia gummosa DSM 723 TaxID=1121388 RepID=A0A8B6XA17_9BURK|nr:heme ABC transporter permease CcmC [Derxia gummosa]